MSLIHSLVGYRFTSLQVKLGHVIDTVLVVSNDIVARNVADIIRSTSHRAIVGKLSFYPVQSASLPAELHSDIDLGTSPQFLHITIIPTELVLKIFSLLKPVPATAFGLTCQKFWSIHRELNGNVRINQSSDGHVLYLLLKSWMGPNLVYAQPYKKFVSTKHWARVLEERKITRRLLAENAAKRMAKRAAKKAEELRAAREKEKFQMKMKKIIFQRKLRKGVRFRMSI
jgi:hypothetical protein